MSPNMSSRSSSHGSNRHDEPLLPFGTGGPGFDNPSLLLRIRSVLSRNLVRRVLLWVVASIVLVSIILYTKTPVSLYDVAATHHQGQSESPGEGLPGDGKAGVEDESPGVPQVDVDPPKDNDADKPDESDKSDTADAPEEPEDNEQPQEPQDPPAEQANDKGDDNSSEPDKQDGIVVVVPGDEDKDHQGDDDEDSPEDQQAKKQYQEDLKRNPWLKFKHLDGYYHGVKTLVNKSDHVPEYPNPEVTDAPLPEPKWNLEVPHAKPYNPYDFTAEEVQECFLDPNNTIAAPDIFAYDGVPQHFPDPVMGSYSVLGLRDDVCFDRHGRYGPYGLGYSKNKGGAGVGQDTERKDTDYIWEKTGQIDYTQVDWMDAQKRCYESNEKRFKQVDPETEELEKSTTKIGRTAVVIRSYTGFKWTDHAILNFRALINEVSLKSGGEMDVHILVQVRDTDVPVWSDDVTVQRLLDANVPPEFHGLVTLWSEPQMRLYYPGKFDDAYSNPSGRDIHGVYRSGHFPLQIFAMQHPEYEHFWNWEMDMRVLGSYYEIFHRMAEWAKTEARPMIWERAARYYIPSYHGTWEEFSKVVQQDTVRSGLSTPFGPLKFSGRKSLRFEAKGQSVMPENCDAHSDRKNCGVGEDADIITLNPIFDTDQSGWFFGLDAVGYGSTPPPRRAAIITASRISRRLLMAMHEEVWRHHHTMFSEMFPASVAFHHGFKAVFAPHPIYLDRAWYPIGQSQDAAFNGGRDHSTSGHGSPFDIANEHNHKGSSWYFNSEFSGLFWRRWLGYVQKDGRGKFGGRVNDGKDRGGKQEEESDESSGRLCSRSMVLHPIKWEHPNDPR